MELLPDVMEPLLEVDCDIDGSDMVCPDVDWPDIDSPDMDWPDVL